MSRMLSRLACVASRETEQRARLPDLDFPLPEFRVGGQRPVEQRLQVLVLHRAENVNLAAAQQRRDHLERRVLGRRADERHDTLFDGPQQRVLLRLVEAVYLVDEQERGPLVEETALAGRLDHFAHLLHARRHGREGEEGTFELRGDDPREGGLAHARRTPEDERGTLPVSKNLRNTPFRPTRCS